MPDSNSLRLLDHFPPTPTDEWERRIEHELRGRQRSEILSWTPFDGVEIDAFYRRSDVLDLLGQAATDPPLYVRSQWRCRQDLHVSTALEAEQLEERVRTLVEDGVERVGVVIRPELRSGLERPAYDALRRCIDYCVTSDICMHLDAGASSLSLAHELGFGSASYMTSWSIANEPLTRAVRDKQPDASWQHDVQSSPACRVLLIDSEAYHDAGADTVLETALLLAELSEYLHGWLSEDLLADDLLDRIYVGLAVGGSYFVEIARLRALRPLMRRVLSAYGVDADVYIPIHAATSRRNMTRFDPASNLLRATTEATAAVLGGCDDLLVRPYDTIDDPPTDQGLRLSRLMQHLLRDEAHFDRVNDPSAGAYYIEILTDRIGRASWNLFQDIEERGGFTASIRDGWLQRKIATARTRLRNDFATSSTILVGTNQFPDINERILGPSDPDSTGFERIGEARAALGDQADALPRVRLAQDLESIRRRTARQTEQMEREASVTILPIGPQESRRQRVQFVQRFLGCGGFTTRVLNGVEMIEDVPWPDLTDASVVVLAGSDEALAVQVIHELKKRKTQVLIGQTTRSDESSQLDFMLYRGADMLRTLSRIHDGVFGDGAT